MKCNFTICFLVFFYISLLGQNCEIDCPPNISGIALSNQAPAYVDFQEFQSAGGAASCDVSGFNLIAENSNGLNCPETITRIYEIIDQNSESYFCDHILFLDDIEPPVLTCPNNVSITCDVSSSPDYQDLQEFLDAGGSLEDNGQIDLNSFVLFTQTSDGVSCPETVIRTYEISDDCGNYSTCEQNITVNDDIDPLIICPPDINSDGVIADFPFYTSLSQFLSAGGSASDNCSLDASSYTIVSEVWNGANCPSTTVRVYRISDDCHNYSYCNQVLILSEVFTSSIAVSACTAYTSPSGNHVWTESGVYEDLLESVAGCDSILTIDLTIEDGMISNDSNGEPGSLVSNLACSSSLDVIVIPSDMDTIVVTSPLNLNDDIILRSANGHQGVIRFEFLNEDLMNQHFGMKISSGANVTLENVILIGKDATTADQVLINNGDLIMSGQVKVKIE